MLCADAAATIVVIEDDGHERASLCGALENAGYRVIGLESASEALEAIRSSAFDIVISNIKLSKVNDTKILKIAKQKNPDATVIITADRATVKKAVDAVKQGAHSYFVKPVSPDRIKNAIANVLKQQELLPVKGEPAENLQHSRESLTTVQKELQEEIAERKRVERALREREEAYFDLLENADDLIQSVNPDGRFLYVNRAWRETLKYTQEEVDRLSLFDIIHPDSQTHCQELFQQVISGGSVSGFETVFIARDGRKVVVEGSANCKFVDGKPVATRGIFRDITRHRRAEESLHESQDKLQLMFEAIADGIAVTDLNGIVIECNEKVVDMYGGASKDDILGKNYVEFTAHHDRERVSVNMQKTVGDGSTKEIEYTLLRLDGSEFPAEVSSSVFKDTSGNPVGIISIIRDITSRKRIEKAIIESEQKYREVVETSQDMIATINLDGQFLFTNKSFKEHLGYSDEEISTINEFELVHPLYVEAAKEQVARVAKGKNVKDFELKYKTKVDSYIDVLINLVPMRDFQGNVAAALTVARDITERKHAEEELKLRAQILDSATDSIFLHDMDGNLLYANEMACRTHGYSREEFMKMKIHRVVAPERVNGLDVRFQEMLEKGEITFESDHIHKDGSIIPVEVHGRTTESGGENLVLAVVRDITRRKRGEEILRESEGCYRSLVQNAQDIIYTLSEDGLIASLNPVFETITGWSCLDWVGKQFASIVHPDDLPMTTELFQDSLRGDEIETHEVRIRTSSGGFVLCEIKGTPQMQDGKVVGFLGIARDITDRKRLEIELQEKNEQLDAQNEELQSQAEELMMQQRELKEKTREVEEANQAKSEFLANMSHELRTPLSAIIGFSELMIDEVPGKINEGQKQCLDDILSSGKHLLGLINEVLDLSRVESGRMRLMLTDINLMEIIKALRSAMIPIITPRKQSLEVKVEEGLPLVRADRAKVRQVLFNLLSNATEFTPSGGRLKIEAVRKDGWCQVSVFDNGIGIKKEDHKRVFEPFCQLDNPLIEEKKGAGLGLTLVRQIIEKHGGQVWVESEYGRGSQFAFTLPVANVDAGHIQRRDG